MMPPFIQKLSQYGSIPEITTYIVDYHRKLHNIGVDSRPTEVKLLTRPQYIAELMRLHGMLREVESRIDVC